MLLYQQSVQSLVSTYVSLDAPAPGGLAKILNPLEPYDNRFFLMVPHVHPFPKLTQSKCTSTHAPLDPASSY